MRGPKLSRRAWIASSATATLLIIALILAVVPATRTAVVQAACDLAGLGCPDIPGAGPGGEADRLLEMDPREAATWGHYAALGDSYSSGDGADDYASGTAKDASCYRSANAFPQLVASEYEFAGGLSLAACSGEWGHTMLEELGEDDAQLNRLTPETSLVTLGIGGNDLGFSRVLRDCMLRVPLLEPNACVGQQEDIETRQEYFFEDTFGQILAEVRDRAPDTRILVVGYPRIFPSDPSGLYYTLTASDQVWLNDRTDRFNSELRGAVEDADAEIEDEGAVGSVEYIDLANVFDGHEVGTDDAWVHGVTLQQGESSNITVDRITFHPTSAGHNVVASRAAAQISAGPDRPVYVTRETIDNLDPAVLAAQGD